MCAFLSSLFPSRDSSLTTTLRRHLFSLLHSFLSSSSSSFPSFLNDNAKGSHAKGSFRIRKVSFVCESSFCMRKFVLHVKGSFRMQKCVSHAKGSFRMRKVRFACERLLFHAKGWFRNVVEVQDRSRFKTERFRPSAHARARARPWTGGGRA